MTTSTHVHLRRVRRSTATAALLLAISTLGLACSTEVADADDSALAKSGAVVLTKGVEHPAGLLVVGKHLYYSSNHFVASGDPELDQANAYWTGTYNRVPLAGGAKEEIEESGLTRVRSSGGKIFGATGSSCWISTFDTSAPHPQETLLYPDDNFCEDLDLVGFEVVGNKIAAVLPDGRVVEGDTKGNAFKEIGHFDFGKELPFLADESMADGKIFALTYDAVQGSNEKQTLLSMPLAGGSQATAYAWKKGDPTIEKMVTDGDNLYFAAKDRVLVLEKGAKAPRLLADSFGRVGSIAVDGSIVVVADTEAGAIYAIRDALKAPVRSKVIDAKGVEAIAISGKTVYFGTSAVSGNKPTGVIASIELPKTP